jgi:hypothetical protein
MLQLIFTSPCPDSDEADSRADIPEASELFDVEVERGSSGLEDELVGCDADVSVVAVSFPDDISPSGSELEDGSGFEGSALGSLEPVGLEGSEIGSVELNPAVGSLVEPVELELGIGSGGPVELSPVGVGGAGSGRSLGLEVTGVDGTDGGVTPLCGVPGGTGGKDPGGVIPGCPDPGPWGALDGCWADPRRTQYICPISRFVHAAPTVGFILRKSTGDTSNMLLMASHESPATAVYVSAQSGGSCGP